MDDAFKRLEELVAVPAKKKRVYKPLTPEQKARKLEQSLKWNAENREKQLELKRKRYAENPKKYRESANNKSEREASDHELFAINQTAQYARTGDVARDITANCPEPTRSKLQALVDQIRADPSAGRQVVGLLCNMRELRKLELAEQQQATENETEN